MLIRGWLPALIVALPRPTHVTKPLGKLPCTGMHSRLRELLVAYGKCDLVEAHRAFHGLSKQDTRGSAAGLRGGRHRFRLRRWRRSLPPGANGAAFGGPRAGATLAAWRFSHY